jgi:phenylalanyl-tRNA synthetase alpha chain
LIDILTKYKFAIYAGDYDIENTYHNFTSLNTYKLHPARQSQDTIYINEESIDEEILKNEKYFKNEEGDFEFLLRTHTSAQQTRIAHNIIEKIKKDHDEEDGEIDFKFKYATLGRTYRNESDGTHSPMFHQVELVAISSNIYPQDLIDMITNFLSDFFEILKEDLKINLRANYFPFTNPSWEVDLFLPSRNSWIEILGCGMIHEKVIENMGLDSKIYRGYALGAGLERLCMLKNNIPDLRSFFESDVEWLKYYSNYN